MQKGVSGFSVTGIFPFKPEKFNDVDFIFEIAIQTPIIIDPENINE